MSILDFFFFLYKKYLSIKVYMYIVAFHWNCLNEAILMDATMYS